MKKQKLKNWKRYGLLPVLTLLILFAFPLMANGAMLPFAVEIPRNDFPIRTEPSDQSKVLITLPQGHLLYPEDSNGNWYQVPFKDGIGYVHKNYVNATTGMGTVSVAPGASLHESMSTSSVSLSLCSKNTEVTVVSVDREWCQVTRYGSGQAGYILTEYLDFPNKSLYSTVDITVTKFSVIENDTKMRTGPGTEYSVIANLPVNSAVEYIFSEKASDGAVWHKVVATGGKVGYVLGSALKAQNGEGVLAGKIIVIDPGHGSYRTDDSKVLDGGAVGSNGLKEKDVTMKVANYLKTYLQKSGATIILTRSGDTGILTLTDRADIANSRSADMFISVHCNSSTETSAKGTETYYCTGNESNSFTDDMIAKRKYLATVVQNKVFPLMGTTNRGVKIANYQVLLKTTMPSILVETAFISNSSDMKLLNTSTYQDKAAQGIYQGVLEYFKKY